jgi:HD-GYP domain-containing protein (c-di-GMP phosphodiesterase class II)
MDKGVLLGVNSDNFTEKTVADCTESDILATDVFNSNGYKLLCANTVITDYIKTHLGLNHIRTIPVYKTINSVTENSRFHGDIKKYYGDTVNSVKKIVTNLSAGHNLNYDAIVNLTDSVLKIGDIRHCAYIVKYINQIKSADQYTYTHSINVAFYAMLMAKWMGLREKEISLAVQSGLLHDLGKIKIPSSILKKKGPLTTEEYEVIKTHPMHSYKLLLDNADIDMAIKEAVLLHHERFDGLGYPLGTTSISFLACIIAIADVYDAMTSDRVYKKGVTPFKVFEYFQREGAGRFDWHLLNVFISHMSALLVGAFVKLTSGDTAKIVCILPDDPLTPILYLNSQFVKLPATYNSGKNKLDIECVLCK